VLPAAAKGTGPKAAKAFARYYFRVVNYSALSGHTMILRKLSSPKCASCRVIARNIEGIYARGGRVTRESWRLRTVTVLATRRMDIVLSLGAFLGREVIVHGDGSRKIGPAGKQPMTMRLHHHDAAFAVTALDLVS
jgi:hypothetical protein